MMRESAEHYGVRARHASGVSIRAGVTVVILASIVEVYMSLVGTVEGAAEAGALVGLTGVGIAGAISVGSTVFALYIHLVGPRRRETPT